MKKYDNIILLITEGVGLSSSWQGNALLSSEPRTFQKYWQQFPHAVLNTKYSSRDKNGFIANPEINYLTFISSNYCSPNRQYLENEIKTGAFFENGALIEVIERSKQHYSSVHLILTISQHYSINEYSHLRALITALKEYRTNQVYLHLILDHSFKDKLAVQEQLDLIEKIIEEGENVEIVSIGGMKHYVNSEKLHNTNSVGYRELVSRQTRWALSANQAVIKYIDGNSLPEEMAPVSINEVQKNNQLIKDFDIVLFADYNLDDLEELIYSFICDTRLNENVKRPKSLTVSTLFPISTSSQIISLYQRNVAPNLFETLVNHDMKVALIAEGNNRDNIKSYLLNAQKIHDCAYLPSPIRVDDYIKSYYKIYDEMLRQVIKKAPENNVTVVVFSFIDKIAKSGRFSQSVDAFSYLDSRLNVFSEMFSRYNIPTLMFSGYGRGENIISTSNYSSVPPTMNPVPALFINGSQKNQGTEVINFNQNIMFDLFNTGYNLSDLSPTILALLGLTPPAEMSGRVIEEFLPIEK